MIGLYIAFILPVILRLRKGDKLPARGLEPRQPLQVDRHRLDHLGRVHLDPVPAARRPQAGIPWKDGFDWDVVNYAPLTVGGALLLFGGWWVISAKKWFKGPVRMGTEEELEQLEAKQEAGFDLPAETQYDK